MLFNCDVTEDFMIKLTVTIDIYLRILSLKITLINTKNNLELSEEA